MFFAEERGRCRAYDTVADVQFGDRPVRCPLTSENEDRTKPSLAMRMAEARLSQLATALCSRARACSLGCRVWVLGLEKAGGWLYIPNEADRVTRIRCFDPTEVGEARSSSRRPRLERRARWDCPHGNGRRGRADRCVQRRESGNRGIWTTWILSNCKTMKRSGGKIVVIGRPGAMNYRAEPTVYL